MQELLVEIYEYYTDLNTRKMNPLLRRIIYSVANLYRFTPIVLFGCMVSMASMTLDMLIADVNTHQRSRWVQVRLLQWRRQFSKIYDFIDAVNAFFDQPMLCFFVQAFISIIVYLFRIIAEMQKFQTNLFSAVAVLRALKHLFYFIIVTVQCEKITRRVTFVHCFVGVV